MKVRCRPPNSSLPGSLRYAVALFALALGCALSAGAETANPDDLPSTNLSAKRSSYVPPPQELLSRYAPATVKLTVKKFGVPLDTASGFFVNAEGVLITRASILRTVLNDNATALEITTSDKKSLKDWHLIGCGRTQATVPVGRLCALATSAKPKRFFSINKDPIPTTGDVNIIGHPANSDFTIVRGTLKPVDGAVTITAALEEAHGGGAVFTNDGVLIGVADPDDRWDPLVTSNADRVFRVTSISTELDGFTDLRSEGLSLAESRQALQAKKIEELKRLESQELAPALDFAAQDKPLAGLSGFHEVSMSFGEQTLVLTLPNLFTDCSFVEKRRESTRRACAALDGAALLSVRRMPNRGFEDLLSRAGQRLTEAKPITAIERLIATDTWDLFEPLLSESQKLALRSDVSGAQCQAIRANPTPPVPYFSGAAACRFNVARDQIPSGQSVNVWILKDQFVYDVSIWMNDTRLADYFARVPSLAILTAHAPQIAKLTQTRALANTPSEVKPSANYKLALPDAISFRTARADSKGHQVDFYGKKLLLDQFEDTLSIAIKARSRSYLPPDFDSVAMESTKEAAKIFGAKLQLKTIENEAITVSGQAARLITVFATDAKGRSALMMSATVFFNDQTFEISEVASTKDPSSAFREFKTLLDGFKRR